VQRGRTTTDQVKAQASSEILQLPAGPLTIVAGGESRKEKMDQVLAAVITSGDVLGGGGNVQSQSGRREAQALFGELDIPIVTSLQGSLAIRHDRYSDFGNTTNPKAGLRWRPSKALLLRAAYGTGFRAPSLPELYTPTLQGNTAGLHSDPERCLTTELPTDCGRQFNTRQGGNPNLKPEKSFQYTLGAIIEPTPTFSCALDYFDIRLEDQIQVVNESTIFGNYSQYGSTNVVRGPVDPRYPALPGPILYVLTPYDNLGESHLAGFDIDLKANAQFAGGDKLTAFLTGTYFHKYEIRKMDGSYSNIVGRASAPYGAIVRWRHSLSVNWQSGPWEITLSQNYQKGYVDQNLDPRGTQRKVAGYETWDAQVSHKGLHEGLTLTFGIRNLLNRRPPFSNQQSTYQVGYDPSYADPRGRLTYALAKYQY
ncbi:MAG TPA: TonB-dependent receptor, partial [Burkholderiales bacterium]|nr:TonB-dependent receptor [Burkholderiales bacterium]